LKSATTFNSLQEAFVLIIFEEKEKQTRKAFSSDGNSEFELEGK
jgi:hypothetical protein